MNISIVIIDISFTHIGTTYLDNNYAARERVRISTAQVINEHRVAAIFMLAYFIIITR